MPLLTWARGGVLAQLTASCGILKSTGESMEILFLYTKIEICRLGMKSNWTQNEILEMFQGKNHKFCFFSMSRDCLQLLLYASLVFLCLELHPKNGTLFEVLHVKSWPQLMANSFGGKRVKWNIDCNQMSLIDMVVYFLVSLGHTSSRHSSPCSVCESKERRPARRKDHEKIPVSSESQTGL